MRFLSLWQPWASLMAIGAKRIETRGWSTDYRGPVGIHAAKFRGELDLCAYEPFRSVLAAAGIRGPADLPFGAILAVGELADCKRTEQIAAAACVYSENVHELKFGNYEPGRWGWIFGTVDALPEPFPWSGRQGLWADATLENIVRTLLR